MLQALGPIVEMILWIISQGIVAIITLILFYKYYTKRKEGMDARFDLGLAIFFTISLFVYLYYLLCSYFLACDPMFAEIVILISMISLIEMVFAIEHVLLTKSRYVMTIFYIINLILVIVIGLLTGLGFLVFPMSGFNLLLIVLLPMIYFYMAYKSSGEVRKRSILFGIGFLLSLGGGTLRYDVTVELVPDLVLSNPDLFYIGPMVVLSVGLCVILFTYLKYFD